ncbi:PilZ domain-containing protein [bacterium]|nr:PilZ domain-containing protein [bacterium]
MQERRRIPRVEVYFVLEKISLNLEECGQECRGVVKDISIDGILLETNAKLNKHDIVELNLSLTETGRNLNIEGRVCWVEKEKARCVAGLEFMDISEKQREMIEAVTGEGNDSSHH